MRRAFALIFFLIFGSARSQNSIFCSEDVCDSYLSTETCIKLPDACRIQNSTHNGLFLPHPGPCNCCDFCLENQAAGSGCSVGDPSYPTPTVMCGPGLSCQFSTDDNQNLCQTMQTPCTNDQQKYDINRKNGNLGHLQVKPVCDASGNYAPYFCIPGEICYCMSEDGRRIFGEIPFISDPEYKLRCKCSRERDKFLQMNKGAIFHDQFFRCQSNGDYDTLQCIGSDCLCVDIEDGHLTYPNAEFVNMTLISAVNLACFNNETHKEAEYYRDCEEEYIEQAAVIKDYKDQGFEVYGYTLPNCQPDGHYGPVQQTRAMKYCVDPLGNRLEHFEISLNDPLADSMNCKCARTRSLMQAGDMPECCRNGNYQEIQCRRGLCRCVDENGIQTEKEVEYDNRAKLQCYRSMCSFE